MMLTILLLSSLLILLALSAFCSSSETVFFAFNPIDVRRHAEAHPRSGQRIRELLAQPTRLLSAILIVNTLVNITAASFSYRLALRLVPDHAEQVTIPVMTLLLLVFGEFGPKRLGLMFRDAMARFYAPFWKGAIVLTTPLRMGLESITHAFEPVFRLRGRTLSDDEFETVVDLGKAEGVINAEELAMVKAIVDLEDQRVSDIMTPRVDVRGIDLDDPEMDPARIAREFSFHYLLLYRGTPDRIAGFLDVRRFLLDDERRLDAATLPPGYVPESLTLNRLLRRFQAERRRIAAVVDEYGGLAGVVTRGDIIEEITGDIYDELSRPRPVFQAVSPDRWLIDPSFNLDELNRALDTHLEAEGADRLAGWITSRLGRLPECGDVVEDQGCRVRVLRMDERRVTLAELERIQDGSP